MKYRIAFLLLTSALAAEGRDLAQEIPDVEAVTNNFDFVPNVAQFGEGDWSQAICIARHIPLYRAFEIAEENRDITYFFRVKGRKLVLPTGTGDFRCFHEGDTIFFSGKPHWGSAPNLADGFIKKQ